VVFTGKLLSMVRKNAQQIIADIGGNDTSELTKDTDFLIVGQQDYKVVGEKGISEKQQKAFKMVEDGSNIEIISESEFLGHI
jgi:DNA polymerase-3 subunit epsilon